MNADFLDLLTALSAADARFLIVGGYAVGVHGRPRATKNLDLWIEVSADNAKKVMRALRDFGAPLGDLTETDLEAPGTGFKMGEPPSRVDILTHIEGVRFDDAWPRRVETSFGSVRCAVIGRDDLITNKRAAGRPQDLADVDALERSEKSRPARRTP
jgi:hypothetical protein